MKGLWSEQTEYMLEKDFEGVSIADIARELDLKYHSVAGAISRGRLKYFIFRHGHDIIKRIKALSENHSATDLAKQFNTKEQIILAIIHNTAYLKFATERLNEVGNDYRLKSKKFKWRCPSCSKVYEVRHTDRLRCPSCLNKKEE